MTRPACWTCGNCTMRWPPARTTTRPIRSSPTWTRSAKANGFARRCVRTERSRCTTAATSTRRAIPRTDALTGHKKRWPVPQRQTGRPSTTRPQAASLPHIGLLLVGLRLRCRGLFGLVVRQRRYGIGVVLDFGFRRVLAVEAELLLEPGQDLAATHEDLRLKRQQKSMSRDLLVIVVQDVVSLADGEVRRNVLRDGRYAHHHMRVGVHFHQPAVRRDDAELGILHHEAVLRTGLRNMVRKRHDALAAQRAP